MSPIVCMSRPQLVSAAVANALWGGVLDASRGYDWTRAGVRGGIPTNFTKDGSTIAAGASAATINSRLSAAGNDTYVELGAGTFNLASGLQIDRSRVILRGQGASTVVNFSGTSSYLGLTASVAIGSTFHDFTAPAHSATWSSGFSAGTTVIGLSSVTGLSVGDILFLQRNNDGSILANVPLVGSDLPFSYDTAGGGGNPGVAEETETQEVTAINGLNVTITPGVRCMDWAGKAGLKATWSGTAPLRKVGLENMVLDHTSSGGDRGVAFLGVKDCWYKNVKSRFAPRNHVWYYQGMNGEFRDSFLFEGVAHASQSYGIETGDACDCLTENNISVRVTSAWMVSGCSTGCVRAYNYSILDTFAGDWMQGANYFHCTGSQYVLDEGNNTPGFISDQVHGPSSLVTAFRNVFEGWESGKAQQTTPVHIYTYSRYFNIIGNVLGRQGFHTDYEFATPDSGTGYASVYHLGYGDNDSSGGGAMPADDAFVKTSLMRWGNCTPINSWAGDFNSGEVPSSIAGSYDNAVPASHALSASFYRSSRPPFFGSASPVAWPPVGPDVSGGDISNKGGRAWSNPAKRLYDAATVDGQGEILTFDGLAYYA